LNTSGRQQRDSRTSMRRAPWNAADEFDYYHASPRFVREHAERQVIFEREAFLPGLQLVRSCGLLDSSLLQNSRVLDIGAGESILSEALALAAGAEEVIAVDAVPKQIWAAAAHHRASPRLQFIIAGVSDLPFEDACFDLVVGNLILHHVMPLEPLLESVLRVLRPGGRFIAIEPSPLVGMLRHEKSPKNEAPIRPGVVARALRSVGFDQARTTYWWTRMQTDRLGPLSPAYRVEAVAPGSGARTEKVLRRPLRDTVLPGLSIDTSCPFADMVESQAAEIRDLWSHAESVAGFRAEL